MPAMKKLDELKGKIESLSFADKVRLYGWVCDLVEPHLELNPKVVAAIEKEERRLGLGICKVNYPPKKSSRK